ncbi:MAG: ferric reductase-like transmembrane domain-containing protein [Halocynthiibacter sp.]
MTNPLALAYRIISNRYLFWIVLALPALLVLRHDLVLKSPLGLILFKTGIYSTRLLILTMAITPLSMIFNAGWTRWLVARRRYIGVAAFCYGVAHTLYFVSGKTLVQVSESFTEISLLTGWLSVLILIPLAITSNSYSVRRLGPKWRKIQRWGYPATALALLHWMLVEFQIRSVLLYILPLGLLIVFRFARDRSQSF